MAQALVACNLVNTFYNSYVQAYTGNLKKKKESKKGKKKQAKLLWYPCTTFGRGASFNLNNFSLILA